MTVEDRIRLLDDASAARLLQRFASAQPHVDRPETLDAALVEQFAERLGVTASPDPRAGDLARTALELVAQDPAHRRGLTALIESPAPERYGVVETAFLVSAVLVALQTHVRFERDKAGGWSIKVEKRPTDTNLLKELVRKLLSFG